MIILLNPKSARHNRRIPLSLLVTGAGLEGRFEYEIVDENFRDPVEPYLAQRIKEQKVRFLCLTVMPGPQLVRAIAISRNMKRRFPHLTIIWGGTFPSIHTETVLSCGYVDIVVLGQGEVILPRLVDALTSDRAPSGVSGIAYREHGRTVYTAHQPVVHPDMRPPLPYHRIDMYQYLQRTYLGNRTSAYHSSLGCPFRCGFCSVVSIFEGRWYPQSAKRIADELSYVSREYGVDSVEFFDDNFFTSESRIAEFCERIEPRKMAWWGEGRSDTIFNYSDSTLRAMKNAGCKMIFTGAETSSTESLQLMNKGGTQSPETILEFASRIREYDIVPEFSFIFGSPSDTLDDDIERDLQFIKKIKRLNPQSEIIFYIYAPVLLPGAALFEQAKAHGFAYPQTLEEWAEPGWQNLDLRKTPSTPWMKARHIRRIRNFERVLNAQYPSVSDLRLTTSKREFLKRISRWRYDFDFYFVPLEVRFFLSTVFKYRQPELEGAPQYTPTPSSADLQST
ncbi:MAG TPA: radical SAM protein [Bacteroidota bacterium]|nr:radical SAM protein [Bacteroidota bacterium]